MMPLLKLVQAEDVSPKDFIDTVMKQVMSLVKEMSGNMENMAEFEMLKMIMDLDIGGIIENIFDLISGQPLGEGMVLAYFVTTVSFIKFEF
jgi:hypothetical protein